MVQEHLLGGGKAMTKRQKTEKTDTGAALSIILLSSMTLFFLVIFVLMG